DVGRDQQLFTPSHTMIVAGLGGLIFAAAIAILFASLDEAEVGVRIGFIRVPWSAMSLMAFGIGGLAAFPLDAMWHNAYGVDVTLWSPSHLQLVFGGSLATITLWLMMREGRRMEATPWHGYKPELTLLGRVIQITVLGAVLVGLSVVQGEFDFGVPQFQVLYLPILIAAAGGLALVLARIAAGPWGAVKTVIAFLIIRGVIAMLVGGPFNLTIPRFPTYIVSAGLVEGVAYLLGTQNRLRFSLVSGALVGTIGVFAEVVYLSSLAEVSPTSAGLAKAAILAPITAIAAAVLGGALARPVGGGKQVPAVAALAGGLVLLAAVAYPLPRKVGPVEADIRLQPAGERAIVEVQLTPADAADSATAFGVVSWQGGGRVSAALEEIGPGRFVSSKPLPVSGEWKTIVGLQRGDQVMAAPVYLPADPEIGAPEVPALPERHETFARNTTWLLRETRAGAPWAANVAYTGLGGIILVWIGLYVLCAYKLTPTDDDQEEFAEPNLFPTSRTPQPQPQPAPAGHGHGNGQEQEYEVDGRYGLTHRQIVAASWGAKERPPGDN
ncbi:MAG: hypothetical protein ACRD12_16945, partial [Acidimicrobiales bacterium]